PLDNLGRRRDVSLERLGDRKELLRAFDTLRRDLDGKGAMAGIDAFQRRALEMVTSGKVRDAFDLDKEPDKVPMPYGEGHFPVVNQECEVMRHHQVAHPGRALLHARRLVEAGVSVVTVAFLDWDTHRYNFTTLRQLVPPLDQALAALIT